MPRFARLALFALIATACKGPTESPPKPPAVVKVIRGNNQQALVGRQVSDTIKLKVQASDSSAIPGVTLTLTVNAGGGTLASLTTSTDANGEAVLPAWTMGPNETENTVTVSTTNNVTVTVRANAVISPFNIQLVYLTTPSSSQQSAFEQARIRWRQIVQSELSDIAINTSDPNQRCGNSNFSGSVDDVVIFVELVPIDGPGQVLGSAGPCLVRQNASGEITFVIAGQMRFDVADLDTLEARGQLNNVILHEMAHVLGVGSLWRAKLLLDTLSVAGDPIFTGAQAVAGFNTVGGSLCNCRPVPVENTGGAGTRLSHWRENATGGTRRDGLGRELMTGFLNAGPNPISIVTINSLRDLGFQVDATRADSYSLPIPISAIRADDAVTTSSEPGFFLNEAPLPDPIRSLDRSGVVRLLPGERWRRRL
jgi:hypothetical protein